MSARLGGVVVHWGDAEPLARLLENWPSDDPRFELVVVDNQTSPETEALRRRFTSVTWLAQEANLGFAGGVNRGFRALEAPTVLLLNPDVEPTRTALEALLEGLEHEIDAAGLVPRLVGEDGAEQCAWQLGRLPSLLGLWLQCLFVAPDGGPSRPPPAGVAIDQPAAACLLLRREWLERLGGLDERFYPAWFEDVDLAQQLQDDGGRFVYWPQAVFRHGLGRSVPELGYGVFLWLYYRNLERYVAKHHGVVSALLCRPLLLIAALLRAPLVALRRPRRARSGSDALAGLARLALGAASGWRLPRSQARRWASPS